MSFRELTIASFVASQASTNPLGKLLDVGCAVAFVDKRAVPLRPLWLAVGACPCSPVVERALGWCVVNTGCVLPSALLAYVEACLNAHRKHLVVAQEEIDIRGPPRIRHNPNAPRGRGTYDSAKKAGISLAALLTPCNHVCTVLFLVWPIAEKLLVVEPMLFGVCLLERRRASYDLAHLRAKNVEQLVSHEVFSTLAFAAEDDNEATT
mmetsp:Transcript_45307/g.90459  ORF Transcript_45307/g.90459 Transcript_45307/m.90459 type:complete len:208 (-) Transcript_45307:224-847(-)